MGGQILSRRETRYVNYNNNVVLVARGGRKSSIPAMNLDTLRGRRKGDPQHKCCGKKLLIVCKLQRQRIED